MKILTSVPEAVLAASILILAIPSQSQSGTWSLTEVYKNQDFQITGVTVAKSGRMFVNFPRWSDHYLNAVAEVGQDGNIKPFPDEQWNHWSGKATDAGKTFVCVQSVVADDANTLWVVDAAAPMMGPIVAGGPKLVSIDLSNNQVKKAYVFGPDVVKENSYLNDVRVDTTRHVAYMTDSGVGGIVVVDLSTSKAWRKLDGHPSVKAQPDLKITIDGKPLVREDGKTPTINSDGIALSADGSYLYYQALTGNTLYRIKTDVLRNESADASSAVERVADTFPVDGLWMDKSGNLYLSSLEKNAVVRRTPDGKMQTLLTDQRLRGPDTFSEGPDGSIYITASHIHEEPRFNHGKEVRTQPYSVFRFHP